MVISQFRYGFQVYIRHIKDSELITYFISINSTENIDKSSRP
jgi:hypothetical protein